MTTRTRASAPEVSQSERTAESRRRADRTRATARAEQAEPTPEQVSAPRVDYNIGNMPATPPAENAAAPATTGEETVEQPQLPPAPEPGVTAEQVAQRQEQVEAAQASLDGAQDTLALMNAFASAPPTIKAQVSGELGSRTSSTLNQETTAISENTPDISVEMQGNTPAPAGTIESPAVTEIDLEPAAPEGEAEAEAVVGEPVTTEGDYTSNDNISSLFTRSFSPESGAEDVEQALNNVQTTDPSISTSPGSPPPVPQEGETDPARFDNQQAEGDRLAAETLAQQQAAAQSLPGAERVQLADVHETRELGELAPPIAEEGAAPEGAQQYLNYNQPPEVQTAFDDLTGAQMQESMSEAQAQVDAAAQERDLQHQTEVDSAQQQANDARDQANSDQQAQVSQAESSIETSRQNTEEQQQAAVEGMHQEAETRRESDRSQFDDRAASDQQQIDDRYTQAETEAAGEVQQGERDAEAERAEAERESEDQSWWEAALDFIADLFDALVAAINSIFDAVRAAVNAILDAVRDFAIGLIQLAAAALKGLVEAYGAFLKGLVQGLLGEIFPELARVLTEAIDSAVALATSAIDAVANWLIEAVNAIVEAMRAAIMALINLYQAAINTALSLARAALTGDWTGFIIQLIEAACRVAGLDPQQIFDIIGRARETIQIIVDDPFAFFSNLINALVGGVQRFADNFVTHLQAGIINWLTGTIGGAGITLPERWDLMGVISLIAQILGLTWENLRVRIVRFVGERGVQVLEFVASYVQTLITGGWSGLWERIQQDLTSIKDIVFEQIRNYLVERIIVNAIMYLATLWEPVGWLVNFVIGAWRFYTFIRDQFQRIMQVVSTIVEAVSNIAHGLLDPAQQGVERFLAGLLPLAIDLLARLLGLGNIGGRIREIITSVQEVIWRGIDRLIERVIGMFRGGGAAGATGAPANAGAGAAGGTAQIGERIPIPTAQGEHHLYIVREERGAQEIVESTPIPITTRLTNWRTVDLPNLSADRVGRRPESDREKGTRLLNDADRQLGTLDTHADALAVAAVQNAGTGAAAGAVPAPPAPAAGVPSQAQITTDEQSLAGTLSQLFNLFGAADSEAGTLATRYQSQISMAHPEVQNAISEALESMDRKAAEDGVDSTRRYANWEQAYAGFTDERHVGGRPGGAAFRTLLEAPFNQHTSTYTAGFARHVHTSLLVTPLQSAITAAGVSSSTPPTYPGLSNWDRGAPETFINSQKGAMNTASGLYPRSRGQVIAMIFNASMERPAAATFLDELVAAGLSATSSPFHAMLSQQAVVDLVHYVANMMNPNPTFVAAFAAAGRAITATKTSGSVNAGDQLTLERIRGLALSSDTAIFTQAIYNALNASSNFMTAAVAFGMSASSIRAAAAALADMIMNNIKTKPLFFVRPTDIPRDVPQNVPYVRVKQATTGTIAVAPALYGNIAGDIVTFLNLNDTQIHHVLPLYLGGGHEIQSLAVIFGGSSAAGTPHQMLHEVIDRIDISSYVGENAGTVTLRVEDLARHYREFNILIGALHTDGSIEWDDTGQRLQLPGTP